MRKHKVRAIIADVNRMGNAHLPISRREARVCKEDLSADVTRYTHDWMLSNVEGEIACISLCTGILEKVPSGVEEPDGAQDRIISIDQFRRFGGKGRAMVKEEKDEDGRKGNVCRDAENSSKGKGLESSRNQIHCGCVISML